MKNYLTCLLPLAIQSARFRSPQAKSIRLLGRVVCAHARVSPSMNLDVAPRAFRIKTRQSAMHQEQVFRIEISIFEKGGSSERNAT